MKIYSSKLLDQVLVVSINKTFRTFLLASGLFLVFSMQAKAQEPEIIRGWDNLEEAEFHFDVYYQIVRCSPNAKTQIHLWAFNEGGNVDAIGFTLTLSDSDGTTTTHVVEKFDIGFGRSHKALCDSEDYDYLKFDLPTDIDVDSLTIDITYQK